MLHFLPPPTGFRLLIVLKLFCYRESVVKSGGGREREVPTPRCSHSPTLPPPPKAISGESSRRHLPQSMTKICLLQVSEIEATLAEEKAGGQNPLRELLCPSRALRHAMLVGWGMALFQQANGSEGVVYFTPTVLRSTGITNDDTLYGMTAAVGACKVLPSVRDRVR